MNSPAEHRMADDGDQITLPARFDAHHTEAAFRIVKGHPIDQARPKYRLACWIRVVAPSLMNRKFWCATAIGRPLPLPLVARFNLSGVDGGYSTRFDAVGAQIRLVSKIILRLALLNQWGGHNVDRA
jgi:hypothetical protein